MKRFLPFLCLLCACSGEPDKDPGQDSILVPNVSQDNIITATTVEYDTVAVSTLFSFQLFTSEHGGFGYRIFQDGKMYINQPHIPAVQGMNGFSTEEKAETTARFAIYKLENGIVPPVISVNELDSLGVTG